MHYKHINCRVRDATDYSVFHARVASKSLDIHNLIKILHYIQLSSLYGLRDLDMHLLFTRCCKMDYTQGPSAP